MILAMKPLVVKVNNTALGGFKCCCRSIRIAELHKTWLMSTQISRRRKKDIVYLAKCPKEFLNFRQAALIWQAMHHVQRAVTH